MVLVEETKAGDTSRLECPCDDQERQPLAGLNGPRSGAVSEGDTRSPCGGGGALPSSGTAGRLLPVDVSRTPTLSVDGPRSVPSWISVVLVDGTMAGDTPGRECPREDGFWRLRAGETRPAGVSVGGGDAGLPQWVLRTLWAPMARACGGAGFMIRWLQWWRLSSIVGLHCCRSLWKLVVST